MGANRRGFIWHHMDMSLQDMEAVAAFLWKHLVRPWGGSRTTFVLNLALRWKQPVDLWHLRVQEVCCMMWVCKLNRPELQQLPISFHYLEAVWVWLSLRYLSSAQTDNSASPSLMRPLVWRNPEVEAGRGKWLQLKDQLQHVFAAFKRMTCVLLVHLRL